MRRRSNILVFLFLLFAIFDFIAFQAVKVAFINFSLATQKAAIVVYWSISAFTLLGMAVYYFGNADNLPKRFKTYLLVGFAANLFGKLFIALFLLAENVQRGVLWSFHKINASFTEGGPEAIPEIGHSPLWSQISLVAGSIPSLAMGFGIISGAHDYRIRKHKIYLPNLPKAFDGLTIGQLSDIHSGSFHNKTAVIGGVEMLNNEKPDLVFFTGDLVNNEAKEMEGYTNVFDKVKAPLGVYSVLGNHDYGDYVRWPNEVAKKQNLEQLKSVHKAMGWNLLVNQNHMLVESGEKLAILGIENWGARGFSQYGKLAEAHIGLEEAATKLLLSHDPSHWQAEVLSSYPDIDMAFAGHTHGMQFGVEIGNIKWSPVKYMYKEWAGLYQHRDQFLYVNRGFGYIGYPGRIGIPPEITIFELKSGSNAKQVV